MEWSVRVLMLCVCCAGGLSYPTAGHSAVLQPADGEGRPGGPGGAGRAQQHPQDGGRRGRDHRQPDRGVRRWV